MTATRDQLLAALAEQEAARARDPDDVDRAVARRLGVPVDCYQGYLLVAQAIDTHQRAVTAQASLDLPADAAPVGAGQPLECIADLIGAIGWAAATIYQETAGAGHSEVHAQAARIIGSVVQLRTTLRELDSHCVDEIVPFRSSRAAHHVEVEPGVSLDD